MRTDPISIEIGSATEPTRPQPAHFLLNFVALSLIAGIGVGVAKVSTTLYALHLHASTVQIGLISAAQMIGMLFMSIPVGLVLDAWGPLRLFMTGSIVAGLLYCLTPSVADPNFLLLCTALISFCMPSRFISLNAVFMQQLSRFGDAKAGWFRGSHMIGMFLLGPAIASTLVSLLDFQWVFLAIGVSFAATLILAPKVLRVYQPRPPVSVVGWARVGNQLALLRQHSGLRHSCLIEMLVTSCMMFFTAFIVVIAIRQFALSASTAAGLITAQGLTFVFALMSLGGLASRWGRVRVFQWSFSLSALSLFILGLTAQPILIWFAAASLGLGLGVLQVANMSRIAQIGEDLGQGQVGGLMALIGPLGAFSGTVLGGVLGQWLDLQRLFLFFMVLFVIAAGLSAKHIRRAHCISSNLQGVSQ